MPERTTPKAVEEQKNDKRFKLFRRLISVPYLLALLGLLMPLMHVSCVEREVIAEPSFYELALGVDLRETLQGTVKAKLVEMEKKNPKGFDVFRPAVPDFPKLKPMPILYGIVAGLLLAALFAWFTPLGSLTMGMLSMFALWAFIAQMGALCASIAMQVIPGDLGEQLLKVDPGHGIYAASAMILIGTAMNLAAIIRPIIVEVQAKRAAKK